MTSFLNSQFVHTCHLLFPVIFSTKSTEFQSLFINHLFEGASEAMLTFPDKTAKIESSLTYQK